MTLKSPITELHLYLHLDPVYRLPPVQIKAYPFICILDQAACCVLDTIFSGLRKDFSPASPFVCNISMLTQIRHLVFTTSFNTPGSIHAGFDILPFSSLFFLAFLFYPSPHDLEHMLLLAQSLKHCDCRGFAILKHQQQQKNHDFRIYYFLAWGTLTFLFVFL